MGMFTVIFRKLLNTTNYSRKYCKNIVMSDIEQGKKTAAYAAVNDYVINNMKLGIGSGSTIVYAVERLAEIVKTKGFEVICVPTSFQAKQLIIDNKLQLADLNSVPELDVVIDGADEVDDKLTLIKGGGGAQTQEKIVASCCKTFIVIADDRKCSNHLGENWKKGIPIEVISTCYKPIMQKIEKLYGGKCELRLAKQKAGPVVTDNGNFLIDWKFEKDYSDQ